LIFAIYLNCFPAISAYLHTGGTNPAIFTPIVGRDLINPSNSFPYLVVSKPPLSDVVLAAKLNDKPPSAILVIWPIPIAGLLLPSHPVIVKRWQALYAIAYGASFPKKPLSVSSTAIPRKAFKVGLDASSGQMVAIIWRGSEAMF
jgi:hypothetical protein